MGDVVTDAWTNCYSQGWPKELLVESAWSHPAKFSYKLIERIYDHARAEGWMPPGAKVLDPFAGVGLGALHALRLDCAWQGCELEPKFFLTAQANLAKWMHEYRHLPGWGPWAMVVNGDSRRLLEHVPAPLHMSVSSPPYSGEGIGHKGVDKHPERSSHNSKLRNMNQYGGYGESEGQLGHMPTGNLANMAVASPPYVDSVNSERNRIDWSRVDGGTRDRTTEANYRTHGSSGIAAQHYGTSEGQLGAMAPGMVVSSPPYADGCAHTGGSDLHPEHVRGGAVRHVAYGEAPGNLADMAVSSPPWENSLAGAAHATAPHDTTHRLQDRYKEPPVGSAYQDVETRKRLPDGTWPRQRDDTFYDNLGITDGQTFWEAARLVVQQTYQLLRPGAHAIWVLKAYVRNKAIVDFPAQWQAMCEDVGFVTLHIHHAMLVEDHGTQEGLFGEATTYQTERKSFFRRLAEKKGSPRIDYETVLCMVKPAGEGDGATCCVSSPPYSVGLGKEHTYADPAKRDNDSHRRIMTEKHIADPYYGSTDGNLGNMSEKGT